jgi:hypothetical protein
MKKPIPQVIEHTPNKVAEALTTSVKIHKERDARGVKYYEGIVYTEDGTPTLGDEVEQRKVKILRATCELAGAYPYIFNVVSYIAAHSPVALVDLNPDGFYYSLVMTWEKFFDAAIGEFPDQKHYLQSELAKLVGEKAPAKIIPYDDKKNNISCSVYGQPVIIAISTDDGKRVKGLDVKPNYRIEILVLKALFQEYRDNQAYYINEPKAMYALIMNENKSIIDKADKRLRNIKDNKIPKELTGITEKAKELQSPSYASSYNKAWYYIRLHDTNPKGTRIRINIIDFLKSVAPQFLEEKNGRIYIHDQAGFKCFIGSAIKIFANIEKRTGMIQVKGFRLDDSFERIIIHLKPRRTWDKKDPNKSTV